MKQLQKATLFLLALSLSLGAFWACKRTVKNDEILGNTNMKSAPSDFSGITNAPSVETWIDKDPPLNIGFPQKVINKFPVLSSAQGRSVILLNNFSHEVTWFVKFKGRESFASKSYTGTGKKIDATDFRWRAEADGIPFFVKGEIVDLTLSFLGSKLTYIDSLRINNTAAGPPTYNSFKILQNRDTLWYYNIDDFEAAGGIQTSYSDQADGTNKAAFYVNDKNAVNGHFQLYMKGTDANGNNYCGGSSHEALDNQMAGAAKNNDPSKVFINAYIYGYGKPNSALFFQVFENDLADPKTNIWPKRDVKNNDMWYTIVEVNWIGWKLVSVPYSSFKTASNPLSGGGGNRIREPKKISAFGIELESYPTSGQEVELGLDLVTLTTNYPFQP